MKILLYHRITDDLPDDIHSVSAVEFARQMEWLNHKNYKIISFQDWLSNKQGRHNKANEIIITFDDGYRDNYTNAYPVLRRYNFPATIFLISSKVDKVTIGYNNLPANISMLTWQQVREMSRDRITFGAHSVSHPFLTQVGHTVIDFEIRQSRVVIEQQIGEEVVLFSYPHSSLSQEIKKQVELAGYQAACSYQPFFIGHCGTDRYELQRIGILSTDTDKIFTQKIRGSLTRKMIWYKRSLSRWLKKLPTPLRKV